MKKEKKAVKKHKCKKCNQQDGTPKHPCPYLGDINGDYETKCNCCPDCESNCLSDI